MAENSPFDQAFYKTQSVPLRTGLLDVCSIIPARLQILHNSYTFQNFKCGTAWSTHKFKSQPLNDQAKRSFTPVIFPNREVYTLWAGIIWFTMANSVSDQAVPCIRKNADFKVGLG